MNGQQPGVPPEVVAVITAALAAYLEQPAGNFTITSIQPEAPVAQPVASGWARAGVLEAHLARRQFGLRTR